MADRLVHQCNRCHEKAVEVSSSDHGPVRGPEFLIWEWRCYNCHIRNGEFTSQQACFDDMAIAYKVSAAHWNAYKLLLAYAECSAAAMATVEDEVILVRHGWTPPKETRTQFMLSLRTRALEAAKEAG